MTKAHVVIFKSVVVEEWLVEGAANAIEARDMLQNGKGRFVSKSDFDNGVIRGVRLADENDFEGANLQAVNQTN